MLVHFGRQAKKRDTQKTMNFVHLQKGRRNSNINIERVWAMPNKETFSIPPIKKLLQEEVTGGLWVDPFSNGKRITENTIINDLNPEICADYHMDALDFLKLFDSGSVDGVLYDPPYSLRQVVECYKGFGREVTQETTQASWRSRHLDEIARILKPGGKAICFGWNSSGVGKTRGFELYRILLVPHGGSKNDTIVTVEYKVVRCKECEYYNTTGCSKGFGWCESMDRGVSDDFYCANGAKITNKETGETYK